MDDNLLLTRTQVPGVGRLVAGAVVHSAGEVLVLRRSLDEDFLPGVEELPSGGCQDGETLLEALTRELQEEIGWDGPVHPDPGFSAHFDYLTRTGALARQYTFSVPFDDRRVRLSSEHTGWRWLRHEDLDASDLTTQSVRIVGDWWACQPLRNRRGAGRVR